MGWLTKEEKLNMKTGKFETTKKGLIDLDKTKKKYAKAQKWIERNINPDVYKGTYTGGTSFDSGLGLQGIDIDKAWGIPSAKKKNIEISNNGDTIIIKL